MKLQLCAILFLTSISACKFNSDQNNGASDFKYLNENSRRRLATPEEVTNIYRLKTFGGNTCTAFAVQNADKKPIIFTARHCMNYKPSEWCKEVAEISSADGREIYKCQEIIFNPLDSDFAAMLLDKPLPSEGFQVANFDPAAGQRLQTIGFPSDWYAKSLQGPVVTENCWLAQGSRRPIDVVVPMKPIPMALPHTCATYGGNSGGPMILENSNIVVGLPASFWKSATIRSMHETASMYPTKDVITKHMDFMTNQRISLVSADPKAPLKKNFLSRARCTSTTHKTPIEEMVPIYSSETDFTALKIRFKGSDWQIFRCREDNLCNERSKNTGETIKIKNELEITYTKNGSAAEFRCENF